MLGICCRIVSIGQQPGESVEVEDRGKLPLNHNVNVNLVSGKITGRGWIEERLKRDEELEEEKSNGGHWCHTGGKKTVVLRKWMLIVYHLLQVAVSAVYCCCAEGLLFVTV